MANWAYTHFSALYRARLTPVTQFGSELSTEVTRVDKFLSKIATNKFNALNYS